MCIMVITIHNISAFLISTESFSADIIIPLSLRSNKCSCCVLCNFSHKENAQGKPFGNSSHHLRWGNSCYYVLKIKRLPGFEPCHSAIRFGRCGTASMTSASSPHFLIHDIKTLLTSSSWPVTLGVLMIS